MSFIGWGGGGQSNVEWSRFRNFQIANIKITKDELFDFLITQIYYIDHGTLVLNLVKIDSSVQIVSDIKFFENFLKIV